jgi:hypothetical protein
MRQGVGRFFGDAKDARSDDDEIFFERVLGKGNV